jgi:hypothetical protein
MPLGMFPRLNPFSRRGRIGLLLLLFSIFSTVLDRRLWRRCNSNAAPRSNHFATAGRNGDCGTTGSNYGRTSRHPIACGDARTHYRASGGSPADGSAHHRASGSA